MPYKPKKIQRVYLPERKAFSRNKDYSWFYNGWKWRKTSKAFLSANPICKCEDCVRDGVVLPSNVSDHVRGLGFLLENNIDPYNWDELQPMNSKCHNKKSGKESHRKYRGMGKNH